MDLSVIITTYNRWGKTKKLLDSLSGYINKDITKEIIIIDNNSQDETIEQLKNYDVKVMKNKTNIRLLADNIGFKEAQGKYILRLDNDIVFNSPFYDQFLDALNRKNVGLVVPLMNYGGKHQKSDSLFNDVVLNKYKFGSSVWFFRKSLLEEIGNIDSKFAYYCNDLDFQLRVLQRGYYIAIARVLVIHDNISSLAITENGEKIREARQFLYEKWGNFLIQLYGPKDNFEEGYQTFAEKILKDLEANK